MAALAAVKNVSGKTTFSNGKWACPPFFVFIRPYSCIEAMNHVVVDAQPAGDFQRGADGNRADHAGRVGLRGKGEQNKSRQKG